MVLDKADINPIRRFYISALQRWKDSSYAQNVTAIEFGLSKEFLATIGIFG